jgi:hypothetical protein
MLVVGTCVSATTNSLTSEAGKVLEAAPWAVVGVAATESMFLGGLALMAIGASKQIGNPFTLPRRWREMCNTAVDSKAVKTGAAINVIGALGTAAVIDTAAVMALPTESWPGAFAIGSVDIIGTLGRAGMMYSLLRDGGKSHEKAKKPSVRVREAVLDDIDRLTELDLLLFDKAYGNSKPNKNKILAMLTQRFNNNPGWMFVSEMDGIVEGFVSAFRTDKPMEAFVSWADSTADGTLEGKVVPDGKYVYVANMTVKHEAVLYGAKKMLLANLFSNSIRDGVEYGYFISRMPHFKRWLTEQTAKKAIDSIEDMDLQVMAETYSRFLGDDKQLYDPQLRMYKALGYKLGQVIPNAFEDDVSMNFGVICKVSIPPKHKLLKRMKPARLTMAYGLRKIAERPRLLEKVF